MRQKEYDEMHALESDFWWFVGMRDIAEALLKLHGGEHFPRFLDVGCGTGINLLWVARTFRTRAIVGSDYSPAALTWCRRTLNDASVAVSPVPQLSRGDVRGLPFAHGSFDAVTLFDVLDQFPPDGQALSAIAELYRVLRPGGVACVRVPAYRWLLSSHDYVYESKHRYSAPELARKMSCAGFEILTATYANTTLFPLALLQRGLRILTGYQRQKTDAQPWPKSLQWLNKPFRLCLSMEAAWLSRGRRLPFGLSAMCLGRKP
jgi:SAM-dependent methyltransferase